MLTKLKQKITIGDNKKITSNFLSLSVLQGANFLLPLITFPYLVRVLGIDKFGLIMFAQAFMVYFSMMADYGFNLSGTREISTHRDNHQRIVQIFSSIMLARLGLVVLGFIVMNIVVFSFERFSSEWLLYYLTYAMVIGSALFPIWFFQGMEKMKYITVLSLMAKLFFTLSIFAIVNNPDDYILVPLLNSLGYITVGLISLWIIQKDFKVTIKAQRLKLIGIQLKRGWHIFVSKISINLYTATNTFLLGIFTNDTTVGYYAIAEKVVRIITSIFAPFYQAIYPHVVQLVKQSKDKARIFIQKILKMTILLSGIVWLIVFSFTAPLFHFVFGEDVDTSIELFKVLSPLIVVLPIAFLLFNVTLLAYKMDRYFSKIYMAGGILNLILIIVLFEILESKAMGVSFALLLSEIVITLLAVKILYDRKIIFGKVQL